MMIKGFFLRSRISRLTSLPRYLSYPAHEVVGMPALSPTMTSGTIVQWKKNVGDRCSPGETIAEIETDKASMAFEGQDDFFIAKLLVPSGSEVAVGAPIMVTVEDAETVSAFATFVIARVQEAPASIAPASIAPAAPSFPPTPVVQAVPIPAPIPNVLPKPDVISDVVSVDGVYSVKWGTASSKGALSKKMDALQKDYVHKYGRSGQR